MKVGWRTVTLGDVSIIGAGNSAPQDKRLFEGGTFPFFRTSDVGKIRVGELYAAQDYLNEAGIQKLKLHRAGTILIPKSGASTFLDHRVIMGVDAYVSSHLATLWPNERMIDGRYLFWASQQIVASEVASDTSYPTLSLEQIRAIEIPLPPLEEQRRIVAVLDEAFAAIAIAAANAGKNLASARELFACMVEEILESAPGCQPMTLQSATDVSCSLSYGIVQPGDEHAGGLPIVRPTDLQQKHIELGPLKRIDPSLATGYQRTKLRGGELLLCVRGTTGTLSIASFELAGGNVTRGIVPIRFNPELLSQKLGYYLLLSASVQKQIKAATYGTALMQINIRDLKQLELRVPPLASQGALADRLNAAQSYVERLQANYSAMLDVLTALKQSLLHRAFTGELTSAMPETIAA